MNLSAIYTKTGKGAMALAGKIKVLSSGSMRVLTLVDGKTGAEAIMAEIGKLTEPKFNQILSQLLEEGYIRVVPDQAAEDIFSDSNISSSSMIVEEISAQEFLQIDADEENNVSASEHQQQKDPEHNTHGTEKPRVSNAEAENPQTSADRKTREQMEAAARAKAYAEEQLKLEAAALAQKEAERKMLEAAALLSKTAQSNDPEIIPLETNAPAKATKEDDHKASEEAKARLMREAEEEARQAAEAATLAQAETKRKAQEKLRIAAERKVREQEKAAARAKAYAEEQLRLEAAALARKEAERKMLEETALLSKSLDNADAPLTAESEAARKARTIKEAQEASLEAERKTREEKERIAKDEVEAQALLEAKAREELERKDREDAKARADAERRAREEAERIAREEAKAKSEAKARADAERKAREAAERIAREEAKAQAKREAEAKSEAKARADAERKAREAAERIAREEAKAQAKREAEEKARVEAERKARVAAEAQAIREEKQAVRAEAKRKEREEAEIRAKFKAEEKIWMEAERKKRNAEAAEIKAATKQQAKLEAEARALEKAERKALARAGRSPLKITKWLGNASAIGRYALISMVVVALVILALLHVVNITVLLNPIEKLAEESIHEPVAIKEVHASLWPQPHLILDGVAIGGLSDVKATSISIFPELSTLFGEIKTLKSIEVESLVLDQNSLVRPIKWMSSASKQGKLKFDRIFLKGTSIKIPNLELPLINGDIKLSPSGEFKIATLDTDDRKMTIKIIPNNAVYEIDLLANSWQPPLGPPIVFDQLLAKAEADSNQIYFSELGGTLYGGTIKARLKVNWSNAWNASGNFALSRVNLQETVPKFTNEIMLKGKLYANASFTLQATEFAKLLDAPVIDASFVAHNGSINGIDLVRAMQTIGKANAVSGSTRFDKFSGKLQLKNGHYQYRQLTLKEGQLVANGEADILPDQSLSGTLSIELNTKSRQLRSRLGLSGQLRSPMVK